MVDRLKKETVFNIETFSSFLENELIKNIENRHGGKKELAEYINIHPTTLSQILNKSRTFSDEQVYLLCKFLNYSEIEGEYILILHQIESAQNKMFKDALIKKKNKLKKRSLNLSERVNKDREITDSEKAIFYSSWQYSFIWVFISIEGGKTIDEIYLRTGIDKLQIKNVLNFLREINLCYETDGKYYQNEGRMHLNKNSPHLRQHLINWRLKGIQQLDNQSNEDLNFTAPLSLSKKDFGKIREQLVTFIQELSSTVEKTTPEEVYLINLDCIKV